MLAYCIELQARASKQTDDKFNPPLACVVAQREGEGEREEEEEEEEGEGGRSTLLDVCSQMSTVNKQPMRE